MSAICHDHGVHEISEPHGPWCLTIRIPLPAPLRRHLYLATGTSPRWVGRGLTRGLLITPWLTVGAPGRSLTKPYRPGLLWSLHRWCAHIDVRYTGEDNR